MTPRMTDGMMARTARRRALGAVVVAAVTLVSACGDSGDRPTDEAWRVVWEQERRQVPDAETIIAGGQDVCGPLVGRFRQTAPELTPTPSEALDDAVGAWIAHAESIVFDCPSDRADLADRLATLDVLAAEIDAGLAADQRG